jgi:hypothetical protein
MTFITLQGLQPKSINKRTLSKYAERTHAKTIVKEDTGDCRKSLKLANKPLALFVPIVSFGRLAAVKENESGNGRIKLWKM